MFVPAVVFGAAVGFQPESGQTETQQSQVRSRDQPGSGTSDTLFEPLGTKLFSHYIIISCLLLRHQFLSVCVEGRLHAFNQLLTSLEVILADL